MTAADRTVLPTPATIVAAVGMAVVIIATGVLLSLEYPQLPDLLPVHFNRRGLVDGWQYRAWPRVLMPVAVQTLLALIFAAVAALLLSRPHGRQDRQAPDVRAAAVAAEAVMLIAAIWVVFQAMAAFALVTMWTTRRPTLPLYNLAGVACAVASLVVAVRAHRRLGRPEPRPFVASHWRLGQLYKNPNDPALFVPTRDGRRWTLNFGRPVAGALLGLVLALGVLAPTVLVALAFR